MTEPDGTDSKSSINLSFQGDAAVQWVFNILVSIGTYTDKHDEKAALYGFDSFEEFINFFRADKNPENNNDGSADGNGGPKGKATVYVETDGLGHVYFEVDGVVYTYGRYDGSYSPVSGRYAPYGDGTLLRLQGKDAINFIKDRNTKNPTSIYTVSVDNKKVKQYMDKLYNAGTPLSDSDGYKKYARNIDTYALLGPGGNNCTTITYKALNYGGASLPASQTPIGMKHDLRQLFYIEQGYIPSQRIWGPK